MKFEKYEKPDLEDLELLLEGSFLEGASPEGPGVDVGGGSEGGDEWD